MGWRRRDALSTPRAVQAARLLAWLNSRPDHGQPITLEALDLAQPLPAGTPVLLQNDPEVWFTKLRLHVPVPSAWLPRHPRPDVDISRVSPCALLWHEEAPDRAQRCAELAMLRAAAAGSGPELVTILRNLGWPAAAALVEKHCDEDQLFECGAGRVPIELPSPRKLLQAVFAERELELTWLRELCDGADHWDAGEAALPVPQREAALPGQKAQAPDWLGLC